MNYIFSVFSPPLSLLQLDSADTLEHRALFPASQTPVFLQKMEGRRSLLLMKLVFFF